MPRKTNKIPSNKTILIVVEGQTERLYFSEMNVFERIPGITILPKESSHSDIEHVLDTAINESNSGVYDYVWCVYDKDTLLNDQRGEKLSGLIKKARSKGIMIADSLPSFEVWFLAHYQKPQLYYINQDAVIADLRDFIADYCKDRRWLERKRLYSFLKERQMQAIENCKRLENARTVHDEDCSSCKVHELVLFILNDSRKKAG